jgi:hypothetical protein
MERASLGDRWAYGRPHQPFVTERKKRSAGLVAMTALFMIAVSTYAIADTISPDSDVVSPGNQGSVSLSAAPGATVNTSAQLVIDFQGNKHLSPGTALSLAVDQTNLPAGYIVGIAIGTVPTSSRCLRVSRSRHRTRPGRTSTR